MSKMTPRSSSVAPVSIGSRRIASLSGQPRSGPQRISQEVDFVQHKQDQLGDTGLIADTVHERLRTAILSAEFRPNKRLVEAELADWLHVSRTPIREALLRLVQEGLVIRDRGWLVRDHDPMDILQVLEARLSIEGYAARLAAERMPAADLVGLRDLASEMEAPGISRADFNSVNDRFHDAITAAAGNVLLGQFHRRTKLNYWNLSVPVIFTKAHDELVNQQHRDLISAIAARDPESAEQVGRQHVQQTIDIVMAAVGFRAQSLAT